MARLVWFGLLLSGFLAVPAHAQCVDPGPTDVPIGFGVTSDELMKQKDVVISYFVMGLIDGHLNSVLIGSDPACVEHLVACTAGKTADSIVAAFRRTVVAVPTGGSQQAASSSTSSGATVSAPSSRGRPLD